ncbi:MAG: trypsin-like peptidase domain-containing protein [Desulfobacterales bacterium]|nr:trypsin-like peptidase domain-containing protein [Desulfobacterales bacterium]
MKANTFYILVLFIVLVSSLLFADSDGSVRVWPLPLVESEEVLARWLDDTGFEFSRFPLEYGSVRLRAVRADEGWQIILKPRSPLATEVLALYTQNGQSDEDRIEALWAYLEDYSEDFHGTTREDSDQVVPAAVLSQKEHVVCMKALIGGEHIQFSGFIIDRNGLIISTGHDLQGIKDITVTLYNGRQFDGHIVAADSYRDVALIKIDTICDSSISLAEGRNLVSVGDNIYSIGYPTNHSSTIHSGIVTGPSRIANDLFLLQVSMEIFPGSSGSPVFDARGKLVGIIKGRYRGTDSVGFLIPLETIMEFLRTIEPT